MEKLLKLLNEYFDKDGIFKAIGHNDRLEIFDLEVKDDFVRDETVISKKFGFIKRLVENEKIDLEGIRQRAIEFFYDESPVRGKEIRAERLIMMLSVQDNPIEYLISYLK